MIPGVELEDIVFFTQQARTELEWIGSLQVGLRVMREMWRHIVRRVSRRGWILNGQARHFFLKTGLSNIGGNAWSSFHDQCCAVAQKEVVVEKD